MTLWQWGCVLQGWIKANSREDATPSAPSAEEFEAALERVRGH